MGDTVEGCRQGKLMRGDETVVIDGASKSGSHAKGKADGEDRLQRGGRSGDVGESGRRYGVGTKEFRGNSVADKLRTEAVGEGNGEGGSGVNTRGGGLRNGKVGIIDEKVGGRWHSGGRKGSSR